MRPEAGWAWLAGVLLLSVACSSQAHTRSTSHSYWQQDGDAATVRMVISQRELTRLGLAPDAPGYRQEAAALLQSALRLYSDDTPCAAQAALLPERRDGDLIHRWRLHCPAPPTHVQNALFADSNVAHSHFATLDEGTGPPRTAVLTRDAATWHWTTAGDSGSSAPQGLSAFFALGVIHILTGWDHLVFLLALIVVATGLRELAILATGFTLGHSLTLALAVLGIAQPASAAIEAFIALSIVLVALDNAVRQNRGAATTALVSVMGLLGLAALSPIMPWLVVAGIALATFSYIGLSASRGQQSAPLRLALTAAFGLFHGFGFAGILNDMALPAGSRVVALLGFNLGVEVGQLLLLAAAWPLLRLAARASLPLSPALTASAAGIGVYWYALRLFG